MKRNIILVGITAIAVLMFGTIWHRNGSSLNLPSTVSANFCSGGSGCPSPASPTCNQTPWTVTPIIYTTTTAGLSSPSLGSGCTKHVVDGFTASLNDSTETCLKALQVLDGSTVVWSTYLGGVAVDPSLHVFSTTFPITSYLHNNTDGTQTLVLVGIGPHTSGTATVTFDSHCSNSFESLSIGGHDE